MCSLKKKRNIKMILCYTTPLPKYLLFSTNMIREPKMPNNLYNTAYLLNG